MSKPFLDDLQKDTAIRCVANIDDKLQAVKLELVNPNKPYKTYLREKLESIDWDVQILLNMTSEDSNDEEEM